MNAVMKCTRCDGTGFLNLRQFVDIVGTEAAGRYETSDILLWSRVENMPYDVQVCDCCGDGERWYGEPGEHYGPEDPEGERGPYSYNGGMCECH